MRTRQSHLLCRSLISEQQTPDKIYSHTLSRERTDRYSNGTGFTPRKPRHGPHNYRCCPVHHFLVAHLFAVMKYLEPRSSLLRDIIPPDLGGSIFHTLNVSTRTAFQRPIHFPVLRNNLFNRRVINILRCHSPCVILYE